MEQFIVFVIDTKKIFMAGGENVGRTYSPQEFELEFNSGKINPATDTIRFIQKKPVKKFKRQKA
jgi:hypothetical protein